MRIRPLILLVAACLPAMAATSFVNWTSFTASNPQGPPGANNGEAKGTITFGAITVNVTYVGGIYTSGAGVGYDTQVGDTSTFFSNCAIYTPCIALTDLISNDGGAGLTHTISFDQPIVNPAFHVSSMGAPGTVVDWVFDTDFAVVSGSISRPSAFTLRGEEQNGSILFTGVFSSLSWTTPVFENTTGYTFSIEEAAANLVPEPGSFGLIAVGLAALLWKRRRGI